MSQVVALQTSDPAAAFSGPVIELPRLRTRGPIVAGMLSIAVFFGGFGAWSALAPLSEAALAPGTIKAEGSRRAVQHLEGGIVREILARDGDQVRAGQVLLRLEEVQSASTLEGLRANRWALLSEAARLDAELAGKPEVAFPADILASSDPRAAEAMMAQRVLFSARAASFASQLHVLEARIEQYQATASSAQAQIASQDRQLTLLRQEEANVRFLLRQGLERLPRLLALQRQIAATEGNLLDLRAQVTRAGAQINETRQESQRLRDQRMQDISAEARELHPKLQDAEERLKAATDVATRREIVAPGDGTALSSKMFNQGAVVRPGDTVLELVPARDRLVAEVRVSPTDIDVVEAGMVAEIRLPAFKQRLVPYLQGHVTFLASDVNADSRGGDFYRAQVAIDDGQLEALSGVALRPGMPVEAHIQVGRRSLFRYMAQPLIDCFHRAFHEQ